MNVAEAVAAPSYRHLARLTTGFGLFEHAAYDEPLSDHGYCVDDVARALVVTIREPGQTAELAGFTETYLSFLEAAVVTDGRVHNRMNHDGLWTDDPSIGDWWGRALGGLGFAAAHAPEPFQRTRAAYAFLRAARRLSSDVRACSFAVVGAAELLRVRPDADAVRRLVELATARIPIAPSPTWEWPETRLRYANATLCEALIAGGDVLGRRDLVDRGIELLAFLVETETAPSGWLSLTGSTGRSAGELGPLWDQQPIEAAALADACVQAYRVTGESRWREGVQLAWDWFLGANDSGTPMYDTETGAGYDGLQPGGRNRNRGAESTLAALGTLQQLRAVTSVVTA